MHIEKGFRTKNGFCHITSDKIIFTRDGVIGNVSQLVVGNGVSRILIVYGFLAAALVYFAYRNYLEGDYTMTLVFALVALYLVYGIVKSRNYSATPVILRKDIKDVTYNSGTRGLTRPRFRVDFHDNGHIRSRLIMLPGALSGGESEADKALRIMREEKMIR